MRKRDKIAAVLLCIVSFFTGWTIALDIYVKMSSIGLEFKTNLDAILCCAATIPFALVFTVITYESVCLLQTIREKIRDTHR